MDNDLRPSEEVTLEEALSTLVSEVPGPIQDFLLSPKRNETIFRLSQKYGLHTDTAGVFERAFLSMLLGVSTPQEFITDLTSAGLPEVTVNGLMEDVNQEVFIPLRNAERLAATQPVPEPVMTAPLVPPPSFTPVTQAPPLPPAQPVVVPPAPAAQPQPPVYTPAPPPPASYAPAPAQQMPAMPTDPALSMRTMAMDMAHAKEEHSIVPDFMRQASHAPQATPTLPATPPVPSQHPEAPMPSAPPPRPQAFRAPPPNLPGAPEIRPVREYGTDPYREPVE